MVASQLFIRLEIYHNLLWRKLGSPGFKPKPGAFGNLMTPVRVMHFIWAEKISDHNDPVLMKFVWTLRAIGIAAIGVLTYAFYAVHR